MNILLQIDSCLGMGSTGRITESIGKLASVSGWKCYIAHGARYAGNTNMNSIPIVSTFGEYFHIIQSLLFDKHGLASVYETKQLIKQIEKIKPDVIQLHCIHGYYINYKILFEYLNSTAIPIIWTFHDCWAFTGHCSYFDSINCEKWKTECSNCQLMGDYPKSIIDRSKSNFYLKKNLFSRNMNLFIIPVSDWLHHLTKESFFCDNNIFTIHNGTDINIFIPKGDIFKINKGIEKKIVLGVAAPWSQRKGLDDFIFLSKKLRDNAVVVLVGLNDDQIRHLPSMIIGIKRTSNASELAEIYSSATVFINPTYSDNFPTTNIESLACGTPVVTYDTGGSPEAIDKTTGMVVDKGDKESLFKAVNRYLDMDDEELRSVRKACRHRAVSHFNKDDRFNEYINLYERLIK